MIITALDSSLFSTVYGALKLYLRVLSTVWYPTTRAWVLGLTKVSVLMKNSSFERI
jgi:hypothetical protein